MILNLRIVAGSLLGYQFNLTEDKTTTRITVDTPAAAGTITVANITGFGIGQYVLIGTFGEPTAEVVRIHAVTAPTGTTITLASNTVFDHALDTPVTRIDYNQIEFSHAATLAGIKTVYPSNPVDIQANRVNTSYTPAAATTDYSFYRFKNSSTVLFSDYSDGVPFTGNSYNTVEAVVMNAVTLCGDILDDEYCREDDLIKDAQQAQESIQSMRDWDFELVNDTSSIISAMSETNYDVDDLTYPLKYPNSKQAVITFRLGNRTFDYVDIQTYEDILQWSADSYLTAQANVAATSVTLYDSSSFQDQGTVLLGSNGFVSYTANDKTTGILSGITSAAITTVVPVNTTVWQNISTGYPQRFTVFNGQFMLDIPPSEPATGIAFKIKYVRRLPRLTSFATTIEIPFSDELQYYVAYKIQLRKKNLEEAAKYLALFKEHVGEYVAIHKLQQGQVQKYFIWSNTAKEVVDDWGNESGFN